MVKPMKTISRSTSKKFDLVNEYLPQLSLETPKY